MDIIGKNPLFLGVVDLALNVVKTDFPIFIFGESGVGKGVFARFIHKNSQRLDKPFITMICAGIPEAMIDDELFGHVKGAFTDAKNDRAGKFEAAHGGTLFLDEIGDIPLSIQAKLLRVLQDKELERLGGNRTIKVDVRIISATNKNIPQMVVEGKFRQDLFYRLNVIQIEVPPLRSRLEDVPELAKYILAEASKQNNQNKYFSPKTLTALKQYSYSNNNIRELENIVKNAFVRSGDNTCIMPEHLNIPQPEILPEKQANKPLEETNLNIAQNITPQINDLVQKAMAKHRGVKTKAAVELGISLFSLNSLLNNPNLSSQAILNLLKPAEKLDNPPAQSSAVVNCGLLDKLDMKARKIVELAAKEGKVTNKMVQDKLGISNSSALRLLLDLVKQQILVPQGKGRNICYALAIQG